MTNFKNIHRLQLSAMEYLYKIIVQREDPDLIVECIDLLQHILNVLCDRADASADEIIHWQRKALYAADKTLDIIDDTKIDILIDTMSYMKESIIACEKLIINPSANPV